MPYKDPDKYREYQRQYQAKYSKTTNGVAIKDRHNEKRREERRSGTKPHRSKYLYLERKFGLTPEQYDTLLETQEGVCAICLQEEQYRHYATGTRYSLAVDHDHTTGKVRGLLCRTCNVALGKFGESIEQLRRAADYLEMHGGDSN